MFDALRRAFPSDNKFLKSTQSEVAVEHAFLGILTPDKNVSSVLVAQTAYEVDLSKSASPKTILLQTRHCCLLILPSGH